MNTKSYGILEGHTGMVEGKWNFEEASKVLATQLSEQPDGAWSIIEIPAEMEITSQNNWTHVSPVDLKAQIIAATNKAKK